MKCWEYYKKEKKRFALVYQISCSLGKPYRILSFHGPYKGSASDVGIFRETLKPKLLENERIMCDKAYLHDPACWCPPRGAMASLSVEEKKQRRKVTRIRQLNERLIGRIVSWGVFRRKWNHSWSFHALCAYVAARLTQLQVFYSPLTWIDPIDFGNSVKNESCSNTYTPVAASQKFRNRLSSARVKFLLELVESCWEYTWQR